MNPFIKKNILFVLAFLLVIISNIWVIGSVLISRSEMDHTVVFSQRELRLNHNFRRENSAEAFRMQWGKNMYSQDENLLSDEALIQLGFDSQLLDMTSQEFYKQKNLDTKEAMILFDINGPTYQDKLIAQERVFKNYIDTAAISQFIDLNTIPLKQLRSQLNSLDTNLISQSQIREFENLIANYLKVKDFNSRISPVQVFRADLGQYPKPEKNQFYAKAKVKLYFQNKKVQGKIQEVYMDEYHVPMQLSSSLSKLNLQTYWSTRNLDQDYDAFDVYVQFDSENRPRVRDIKINP